MAEKSKIYTSFQDISPRDYMYFPKGTFEMGKPGRFSRIEVIHLAISMIVLTFAFSFALTDNNIINGFNDMGSFLSFLPISFLGIVTAFFFHELSHKFMAQKYGLWSEFRMYPWGLLLALAMSVVFSIVFAAPGAVMFRGGSRTFETGKIAVAGPLANIIIATITFPLYRVFYETVTTGQIIGFVCLINAFLAAFNLLPIGPLDGAKVVRWNATVWIILFIAAVGVMMAIFLYAPIL